MYKIAIIDDKFPYTVDADAVDKPFSSTQILEWLDKGDWSEETHLKKLLTRILSSDLYKHKELEVMGFLQPSSLLNYISDKNTPPQLIIFDWEYQAKNQNTKKHLTEIIKLTTAHIFIYTAQADTIWQLLIGEVFEKNISRLQLLLKGDDKMSLFTSEDLIMQFIISQFKKAYEFSIGEHSLRFEENKYLKNPSDILILESLLGKNNLLKKLETSNFEITDTTIETIFSDVKTKLYLSKDQKFLMEADIQYNKDIYGPLEELSFLNALSRFGAKIIDKTLERGISKL